MDNADEFIHIFKELENWMRVKISKSGYLDYPGMISELRGSNRQIHTNFSFLKKMGDLRNVITHEKFVIAQPSDEVIREFRKLAESIMKPPKLLQYCAKDPSTISVDDPLPNVLRQMCDNNYSQLIVQENESYRLLSREGVSKWVEANVSNEFALISGTKVAEVLAYEDEANCEYVNRSADVFMFLEFFSDPNRRVQAVIVTEHGKANEKPIGIATAWDAGVIIKEMNIA